MKMNTPTAIFLGLALIAVATFFRQPSISEAQARNHCATSAELAAAVESINHQIIVYSD